MMATLSKEQMTLDDVAAWLDENDYPVPRNSGQLSLFLDAQLVEA